MRYCELKVEIQFVGFVVVIVKKKLTTINRANTHTRALIYVNLITLQRLFVRYIVCIVYTVYIVYIASILSINNIGTLLASLFIPFFKPNNATY